MSHGGDLFALGEGVATESSFEVAFRGYDRHQVDKYVTQVEAEIAALAAEREQAYHQIQALAGTVEQLQLELTNLRHRAATTGPVSFRHLGARVEQIMTLAEEQAEAIRAGALQDIAERHNEAQRILDEARAKAASAAQDFEIALAARRAEEHKRDHDQLQAAKAEVNAAQELANRIRNDAEQRITRLRAEAEQYAVQLRAEAEAKLAKADQEARRVGDATAAHVEQGKAHADAYAQSVRTQLEQELAARRKAADEEASSLRAQAEQHASQVRAQAEQYAAQARVRTEEQGTAA